MAGDWIKMRLDLRDDPSVSMVSAALSCEVDLVVGKLHRLWSWFNQQTRDGLAPVMTADWIDKYLDRPGFAQALAEAGWLVLHSPQGVHIPAWPRAACSPNRWSDRRCSSAYARDGSLEGKRGEGRGGKPGGRRPRII
jgi:hypothetical protein